MRFRKPEQGRRRIRAEVDLTPLIDVVFLLLIFFMLTATFVVQSSIQVEVPEADTESVMDQKNISVTLVYGKDGPDGAGKIYLDNDEIRNFDDLGTRLSVAAEDNPTAMVVIRADARVDVQRLVSVLEVVSGLGLEDRIGIAVRSSVDE